jgi:hypothetical protein
MELSGVSWNVLWGVVPVIGIIGLIAGGLIAVFGMRKKDTPALVDTVDGALKQDWTRTGKIDFFTRDMEGTSRPMLVLRVEERKITETVMGQDVVELRWRLATLEEAKDVVVCWNASKAPEGEERRVIPFSG